MKSRSRSTTGLVYAAAGMVIFLEDAWASSHRISRRAISRGISSSVHIAAARGESHDPAPAPLSPARSPLRPTGQMILPPRYYLLRLVRRGPLVPGRLRWLDHAPEDPEWNKLDRGRLSI